VTVNFGLLPVDGGSWALPGAWAALGRNRPFDLSRAARAFQLLSLESRYFSRLMGGSATLLVTADEALTKAARRMRLPVWDCQREPNAIPVRAW
jgi:hypothetical protein